ncbi:MAG: hypothetical protein ABIH00_07805 [Armatimonadota bacterium]
MKKLLIALVVIVFLAGAAFAASTDTQTVYYEIDAINEIDLDVGSLTLTVDSVAQAGYQPASDVTDWMLYGITTNSTGKKITGSINANVPSNCQLEVLLEAPSNAVSTGLKNLYFQATNLVTSIETVAEGDVRYRFYWHANVEAGLPPDGSRVVTYTLTDE